MDELPVVDAQRGYASTGWLRAGAYAATQVVFRLIGVVAARFRVFGRHYLPAAGGVLICSNHQSFLDPVLVGMAADRPLHFLARKSLFEQSAFRALIEFYNAIPIDRGGQGASGIRATLDLLRQQRAVLMFPEGTRSSDGKLQPLKGGVSIIARRGRVPVVPVAVAGAYEAWPRNRDIPWFTPIHIHFGPPIPPDAVVRGEAQTIVDELSRRIARCFAAAQRTRTT